MNSDDLKNSLEGLFSGLDSTQGDGEKSQLAIRFAAKNPKWIKVHPQPLTLLKNLSGPHPAKQPTCVLTWGWLLIETRVFHTPKPPIAAL
jgi:hypothetical protein